MPTLGSEPGDSHQVTRSDKIIPLPKTTPLHQNDRAPRSNGFGKTAAASFAMGRFVHEKQLGTARVVNMTCGSVTPTVMNTLTAPSHASQNQIIDTTIWKERKV